MKSFCPSCCSGRSSILVINSHDHKDAEELIKFYFNKGTQYTMIALLLTEYNNIPISWLKKLGLKSRGNPRPDIAVRRLIESEIKTTNDIEGYRSIWYKLKINCIQVNRNDVMNIIKDINPEQSGNHRAQKLERRIYTSLGPNAVWHAEGYDKLTKPYGFSIHGCIDGFSRKVLRLRICCSNNDPIIAPHLFLTALEENKICADLLKTDWGTENGIMASMQSFFTMAVALIDMGLLIQIRKLNLWSHCKRKYITWIITFFNDLVNTDALRHGDHFQIEWAWFVFSDLLPAELDKMNKEWNTHKIRRSSYAKVAGNADEMYFLPEYYGYKNCGIVVSTENINHIPDEKDVHYEAHCLLNTRDELLKQ